MSVHCAIFHIGDRITLPDTGFGAQETDDPQKMLGADALLSAPGLSIDYTTFRPADCRPAT